MHVTLIVLEYTKENCHYEQSQSHGGQRFGSLYRKPEHFSLCCLPLLSLGFPKRHRLRRCVARYELGTMVVLRHSHKEDSLPGSGQGEELCKVCLNLLCFSAYICYTNREQWLARGDCYCLCCGSLANTRGS